MQRWMWRAVLLTAGTTVGLAFASWAQDEEPTSCQDACYAAEELCSEGCADADDADACQDECRQQAEHCVEQCE